MLFKAFALGVCLLSAVVFGEITPIKRPLEILPESKVVEILTFMPPIGDPWLRSVLDSPDTMFYDRSVIVPGYQDSFGDPVGFRPNTIEQILINFAVPGGHEKLFIRSGEFHFPFGRTGGLDDAKNTFVVDFWRLPREGGKLLPVVHWRRQPNENTNRIEWMFPEGTVFGEMIFLTDSRGKSHIFEIRTRQRQIDGWTSNAYRPFLNAREMATAVETKRAQNPLWQTSTAVNTLLNHLRDDSTLRPTTLGGAHFSGAFTPVPGAVDTLPGIGEERMFVELLHQQEFRSAKGAVWKQSGGLTSFAASTAESFHVVPKNYNAALFEVSDAFCNRCHQDAGRPFKDYYPQVIAYGELWGDDDNFSWHPFDAKYFVKPDGKVENFNDDNRRFRKDFINAGLIAPYDKAIHTASRYKKIEHSWKKYY